MGGNPFLTYHVHLQIYTEARYSQIEKNAWHSRGRVRDRASDYILGKSFSGETDHKPMVPITDHPYPRPSTTNNPKVQNEINEVQLRENETCTW
jgi:hypothetical protein